MAKEKNAATAPLIRELFQPGLYKRSQGKIARQVTAAAILVVLVLGAWRLSVAAMNWGGSIAGYELNHFWRFGLPALLLLVGAWLDYRLVNIPAFANFLIAVEAEMNKVSWPTRAELVRSSLVVIFCIFFLAAVLFGYDLLWSTLLRVIGILG